MTFSPHSLGDPRPFGITFNTDTSTFTEALTSGNLSIFFVNTSTGLQHQGAGSWGNIAENYAEYTPDPGDVIQTTAALYNFYVVANNVPFDVLVMQVVDPSKVE